MNSLPVALTLLAGCVLVALLGVELKARWLFALGKPAATLALLLVVGCPPQGRFAGLVAMGVLFALCGDVALLSDRPSAFMAGLVLFLVAHGLYTAAFVSGGGEGPWLSWPFLLAVTIGFASCALIRGVWAGLPPSLRVPLLVYAVGISTMVGAAGFLLTGPWAVATRIAAAGGALVFYASDAHLAWNRYRQPRPHHQTITLALYWAGQAGIALAARWVQGLRG